MASEMLVAGLNGSLGWKSTKTPVVVRRGEALVRVVGIGDVLDAGDEFEITVQVERGTDRGARFLEAAAELVGRAEAVAQRRFDRTRPRTARNGLGRVVRIDAACRDLTDFRIDFGVPQFRIG
jgi:hypothetical protein